MISLLFIAIYLGAILYFVTYVDMTMVHVMVFATIGLPWLELGRWLQRCRAK